MNLKHIDLSKLHPSRLNVRKRGGKEIADLVTSIKRLGVLQPLLVRPDAEGYEIIAGQRRYYALCALADAGDTTDPVPCLIMGAEDDAAAIEASLAENIARLPMDEIDQYKAFAALTKQDLAVDEIAERFGITERLVRQRLSIARLLPPILTAYRKGDLHRDTIRLLTMATKAQQQAWWRLFQSDDAYAPEGYRLKSWLFGGAHVTTDAALFDLAEYTGSIVSDLFGEESYFADSEQFWALQNVAIAKAREVYLSDGWTDVIVLEIGQYFSSLEHVVTAKEDGGKVYVAIARNGEVTFHEGQLSRKEHRARQSSQGNDPKPARPELTKPLQTYLDLHRHAAVRVRLVGQHGLAFRLAVAQIIAGSPLWSVQAEPQEAQSDMTRNSLANNLASARFAEERKAVSDLLGLDLGEEETLVPRRRHWGLARSFSAIFAKLKTLSDDDVECILSFVVAECLPFEPDMIDDLGTEMSVSLDEDWQPDEAFFGLLRDKEAINAMVGEIAGADVAAQHLTSTAKVQKEIIKACLEGTRPAMTEAWLPRYLSFPMQSYTKRAQAKDPTPEADPVPDAA